MQRLPARFTLLITSLVLTASPAFAACREGPVRYAVPAQPLADTLRVIARQSGCEVRFDAATVRGKRAGAVRGALTTDAAMFAAVKGTGLEAGPVQGRFVVDRSAQMFFADRVAKSRTALERALRAGQVSAGEAASYRRDLATVEQGVPANVRNQGFLSAAERSSYTALLDRLDQRLRR